MPRLSKKTSNYRWSSSSIISSGSSYSSSPIKIWWVIILVIVAVAIIIAFIVGLIQRRRVNFGKRSIKSNSGFIGAYVPPQTPSHRSRGQFTNGNFLNLNSIPYTGAVPPYSGSNDIVPSYHNISNDPVIFTAPNVNGENNSQMANNITIPDNTYYRSMV